MKKVISSLINLNLNSSPRVVKKDRLWFDHYRYCGRFKVNEAGCLRHMDHEKIDRIIKIRKDWGRRIHPSNQPGSWHYAWQKIIITDLDVRRLHSLCDFFLNDARNRKIVICGSILTIYTNELQFLHDLLDIDEMHDIHRNILECQPRTDQACILLKASEYNRRVYFKFRWLSPELIMTIVKFLTAQESIRMSPSLGRWVANPTQRIKDYYFFDCSDDRVLSMLSLIAPDILSKPIPIIIDK